MASGDAGRLPPLRQTLRQTGLGWYPLIALGLLAIVDEFQFYAFGVLGPDISHSLGIGKATIGALVAIKFLALTLIALPTAAYVQNRPVRNVVAIVTAFAWSVATLFTGFVAGLAGLFVVLLLDGLSAGATSAVHEPLLIDSYPPEERQARELRGA